MNKPLYAKLAAINIKKHARLYTPYIISATVTIAMFYVVGAITTGDGIASLYGGTYLRTVLQMGWVVIGIFSFIFLQYTNSFLMKQRKKELGLYSVLGMEKRHISKIMFFESLFISLSSIALGLIFGLVFDKLATLLLCKILRFEVKLGFHISTLSIILTVLVFGGIFLASLLANIRRVHKSNAVDLLHGESLGEKEPRTKWLLVLIGIVTLAAGYTIAIAVKSPLEALSLFFIAVICVIIGTYCLFVAGSIAVLKLLRKNKKYYYRPNHFNSVSGMIYRMKQNAVGLANICILSTMVLVMLSTTVSMYAATEDSIETRYPTDIEVRLCYNEKSEPYIQQMKQAVESTVKDSGRIMSGASAVDYLSFATTRNGDSFAAQGYNYTSSSGVHEFCFVTAEQYRALTGRELTLAENEVAAFSSASQLGEAFSLFDKNFTVKTRLDSFPPISDFSAMLLNIHYVVVSDESIIKDLDRGQRKAYDEHASSRTYEIRFNVDGTDEEKIACSHAVREKLNAKRDKAIKDDLQFYLDCKQAARDDFYSMHGSFLFLGIILGLLFLMVTVMIIYYKQISEGYDDKKRFEIMQQVGMSKAEVKKSISNQVLTVFFLPLVTAFIHLAFAFPIISRLMVVFNFTNTAVFVIGLLITAIVFAFIYAAVYAVTARAYYKIVSTDK